MLSLGDRLPGGGGKLLSGGGDILLIVGRTMLALDVPTVPGGASIVVPTGVTPTEITTDRFRLSGPQLPFLEL